MKFGLWESVALCEVCDPAAGDQIVGREGSDTHLEDDQVVTKANWVYIITYGKSY
jgi:hypothetical protein